jgi:guanylate kinase
MKILGLLFSLLLPLTTFAVIPCADVFSEAPRFQFTGPRLIILSAPSGGGKTTLAQMLVKDLPNLTISISSTTRAPRGEEKDGVDYHFLSKEEFQAKINRGEFAEWAEVHGNFYGTDRSKIASEYAEGRSVIALVDIKGAEILRKKYPSEVAAIFIQPPDMATLEKRLRGRGTDSEESIQKRLANAQEEMDEAIRYDRVIINDDLQRAYAELREVITPLVPPATAIQK